MLNRAACYFHVIYFHEAREWVKIKETFPPDALDDFLTEWKGILSEKYIHFGYNVDGDASVTLFSPQMTSTAGGEAKFG